MLAIIKRNLVRSFGAILLAIGFMFLSGANVSINAAPYDFDGDGKTDISIWTGDAEFWHLRSSDGGNGAVQFGHPELDLPVPADYTGDGKVDVAFHRMTTGEWFILRSEDNSFYSFPFGIANQGQDALVPGDYDGDGKADPAVYRKATGVWYILKSSTGQVHIEQFGGPPFDIPVPADYDGDGKDDLAIYRYSVGDWWINQSTDGVVVYNFFIPEDDFVAFAIADHTGDGKADPAFVLNPNPPLLTGGETNHEWFVLRSEDQSYYSFPFGLSGDVPAMGDYDGDGRTDTAVFRQSNGKWYLQQSTAGYNEINFGTDNDFPVPAIRYQLVLQ